MTRAPRAPRLVALSLALTFALPMIALTAGCGQKANNQTTTAPGPMANNSPMANSAPAKAGLSTKQKVVLLGGAALLFYLYKRYQKQDQAAQNGTMGANGKPQLYREEKGPNTGAIYYRKNDANHTVVWLSAPQQGGVNVPESEVQQYLPGYNPQNPNSGNFGNINTNPQPGVNGGSVQSADQYANAGGGYGGGYPTGPGGPPGPRR